MIEQYPYMSSMIFNTIAETSRLAFMNLFAYPKTLFLVLCYGVLCLKIAVDIICLKYFKGFFFLLLNIINLLFYLFIYLQCYQTI